MIDSRRLLESLIPVVCPPDVVELGLGAALIEEVQASIASFPGAMRAALAAGMLSYDQGARLWPPARGARAADLSGERAAAYFASWWRSRLPPRKRFAWGLKSLLCMAAYELPAMQARIGYTPDAWIDRVRRARLAAHGPAIARQAELLRTPDPLP